MKNSKNFYITLLTLPLLFNIAKAESNEECSIIKINQINYYQVFSIDRSDSITNLYKEQIGALKTFAEKNDLKEFEILSKDINISAASYIPNKLDVNFSATFQSQYDENLLDKINVAFAPQTYSFSVSERQQCTNR